MAAARVEGKRQLLHEMRLGHMRHADGVAEDIVDQLLRYVVRRDYAAPIDNPRRILDIGSKDGTWIRNMSAQFPSCKVRGCEGFLVGDKGMPPLSRNCRIDLVNLCKRFPYGDGQFDYIHQRLMGFYTSIEMWALRMREIYRMLSPGGYVELVELDPDPVHCGQSAMAVNGWIKEKLIGYDIDLGAVRYLDKLLRLAGFTDIHHHAVEVPMGGGTLARGQVMLRLVNLIYSSIYGALLDEASKSKTDEATAMPRGHERDSVMELSSSWEDCQDLMDAAQDEFEANRTSVIFRFYWARKPLE
ncbi:hypothetical protein SYNPS1DRAFT_24255 [Syncephalis pseudoplumigaleata]|uniref:S-adenosyl-L-methionine-dependent methyltransferase n=1 Tax=Syncephalis pseudoplumigaleata TaxID=1712513 RepID=A0A4P9YV49_9FUNG|nr:hypothetical protein SYNPS1DRAFT_24255 [Syncephalis pseudoplumigaleata]|eukprot:RKP23675.1 hypothetical protein SYNPS1DRAFT_24255 [Syncephalis pseudoplumigaleata]